MKKRFIFILSFAGLFIATSLFAERMRIAVLDLTSTGVPKNKTKVISSMLRTQIIDSGGFTVVERAQMNAILKEQGLQQTGCTDASCAVQIGKLLSAKKILVGEVSKLGKSTIISCRIVDVEKGVADFATQEAAENDDELLSTIRKLVKKLLKRMDAGVASWAAEHSPYGVYLAYNHFLPAGDDMKDLYSSLMGVSAGYIYSYNPFLSFTGDINYLQGTYNESTLIFNSYSVGARTGLYLHEKLYPYVGLALKGIYVKESDDQDSVSYLGYGADVQGGLYIMFIETIGIFVQYNYSLQWVNDEDGTDISGQYINGGIIYKL